MKINEKMVKALNKQINAELYSSYIYLAMAAYFEADNWLGLSRWMKAQSREENVHAMKIYDYVFERGGRTVLSEIKAPDTEWKSVLDAFTAAYAHELKVTAMINDLLQLARQENDSATESMLKWFIDEQVEEEANTLLIVEKLKLIKDSWQGLFMLDKELGERK